MSKLSEIGQIAVITGTAIGGVISSYLGGFDMILKVLLIFIVVDYITGIICAVINKTISSSTGFKGIAKKVFILLLVGLSYMLDRVVGIDIMRNLTIMFYIANEGISILENATILGVPFPEKITDVLEQIKSDSENKDKE